MASDVKLTLRISPAQREWLSYTAKTNNRSQNAEIEGLIDAAMRDDPLLIFIHQVSLLDQLTTYAVSVGEFADDEFESPDHHAALDYALKRLKELGLPRDAIHFNVVTDKGEAA